jgi:hypothetical protein
MEAAAMKGAAMKACAMKPAEAASRASGSAEQDHPERYGDGDKRGLRDGDLSHVGRYRFGPSQSPE